MVKVQIGNNINFIGKKPQQVWGALKGLVPSLYDTWGRLGSEAASDFCQEEASK